MGDRPPGGASRGRSDISWEIDRQVGLVEEGLIFPNIEAGINMIETARKKSII